jgi:hypothetical protein
MEILQSHQPIETSMSPAWKRWGRFGFMFFLFKGTLWLLGPWVIYTLQ